MKKETSEHKKKYLAYISSPEWAKIRADIISVRGEKCELCGDKGTQVHHATYKNLFNESTEDLILLCNRCHLVEHGRISPKKKRRRGKRKPTKKQLKAIRKRTLAAEEKEKLERIEELREIHGGPKYVTRKRK
jgi:5-methylcytosine-specific restriction endonuclease McrA